MPPRPADVGAMLDLYGVQDPAKRDGLDRLSREACQPGKWDRWWDGYANDFSRPLLDHAWLEDRASAIRSFATATVPVLVQTPAYAEAVIRADHPEADDRHIDRAVQFLAERQRVLSKEDPPRVSIIVDECVLHRPIGGRDVIAGQLHHLAERAAAAGAGAIELRVLPHSAGTHAVRRGAFQIFDLPEPVPAAGYIDTIAGAFYVDTGVDRFTHAHGELHAASLSPDESARLIKTAAREMTQASTS